MTSENLTEQEKTDLIQGLSTLSKRLLSKIRNDERNGRSDFNRVAGRKERIERVKSLIDKIKENAEKEACV